MKRFVTPLVFLLLAAVGYTIGSRFPAGEPTAENTPITHSTIPSAQTNGRRKAEAEATFDEKREKLSELDRSLTGIYGLPAIVEGKRRGSVLLEMERIFALATKEEMIEYFASEDTTELEPAVLSAAFARLAELSPEDAVAIWTHLPKHAKKNDAVEGLIRGWARIDPASAERWIDSLDNEKARQAALFSLLDSVLEASPELVERRITEVNDLFQSISLANRLAWEVEASTLGSLADRFLSENQRNWKYQNQLVHVLEVWGERDSSAMMGWLAKQPPATFQNHVLPRVAKSRAEADPARFVREVGPHLADNKALAEMAGVAWMEWLGKSDDGTDAIEWFAAHGKHIQSSDSGWHTSRDWNAETAKRALPKLLELPDGEFKDAISKSILYSLSQSDPRAALEFRNSLSAGHDTDMFVASTLSSLARKGSSEDAFGWAVENLEDGQGKIDAVRFVMHQWVLQEPFTAVAHAEKLTGKLREQALGAIAYEWAGESPEQLLNYIRSGADPTVAKTAFSAFGYSNGGEKYLPLALELPSEEARLEAVKGLFTGWSNANLESAGDALNEMEPGTVRDAAISEFVSAARWTDREAAVIWSLEIDDPEKRRSKTLEQGRRWLNADRATATRWLEKTELIPREWVDELLGSKN